MNQKSGTISAAVIGGVGLVLVLLATIVGWAVIPGVIDKRIEEQVTLDEGSETWDKWEVTPVPIYFRIYVWNVTNEDLEEIANGENPKLQQVGPYVYRETRFKDHIEILLDEDAVKYQQRIRYVYDKELSGGRDEHAKDLNVLNAAFVSASMGIYRRLGGALGAAKGLIDEMLVGSDGEGFVRTGVSVNEMMFSGVELPESYKTIIGMLPHKPVEFTGNRFAYYNKRNDSTEAEVYKIKAGKEDSIEFGKIVEWGGKEILDWWSIPDWHNVANKPLQNAYCNMINGTDGSVFRPFIKKDTVLRIFQTEICRSLHITYLRDGEHMDIPGYLFTMPDDFYEHPEINENNYCFCNSLPFAEGFPLDTNCSKGVIRIGPCKFDSPVVTSNPHFVHAEEKYSTFVDGLSPDPDFHKTFILVEPNSGSMLQISKKLQINVELQNLPGVEYFSFNGTDRHFLWPAFWVDEFVELDEYYTDDLKSKLINPLKLIKILKWTILGIGCLLIGIGAVIFISVRRKRKEFV